MNPSDIIPAAGIIAAIITSFLWVKYVPATSDERAQWADQKEARQAASAARALAFEAARVAAKETSK